MPRSNSPKDPSPGDPKRSILGAVNLMYTLACLMSGFALFAVLPVLDAS